ncbi:MAG: SDR family oxidoreductase [Betaproteobacteria bacterium]|jgi:3-oxoacyl-[acyl-carrier protein] reductase|nr:SDR family oxidoreductase [Betaproteobacteria bacterium]MBK7081993.1 SDR family oxidoreductase [Betaproteobacteria bacterium]MBK8690589.1 SDR family oxidoreductase [Betaproteobacteria bacterium]MBK9675028.1 SDR family oxidoreductase [Betaproteobacteria bacterium]MBL0289490.1 SDR family oxidoreductase [Betaproteobacteria bacterium]
MSKLEGKVALVSGSGRGIGRCIALKLAAEGARVVVNDMDEAPASETVAAIRAAGGEAVACVGSVTATDFAERFVGTAIGQYKGLDIIVNNAGYTWDNVIQKMTDEQWYAMLDVHLTAPFRILRAAAGFIRQASRKEAEAGSDVYRKVVNISSLAGIGGNAGQANYAAAKAGVIGLTAALAKEWGRYKVNVNCVAFGLIRTRLTQATAAQGAAIDVAGRRIEVGVNPDLLQAVERMVPLGRGGTPEEAAGAVYLFCTPESDYISGQTIVCGGGFMM